MAAKSHPDYKDPDICQYMISVDGKFNVLNIDTHA